MLMIKSKVLWLREQYRFLSHFQVHAPRPNNRVMSGPASHLALYKEFFHADLRLPLHPFILNVLDLFKVISAQLALNSFRPLCSCIILCSMLKIRPRIYLFQAFFILQMHPMMKGRWHFGPCHGQSFIPSQPSSIYGWKNRFFFISSNLPWWINWIWAEPNQSPNKNNEILVIDEDDSKKLSSIEVPS